MTFEFEDLLRDLAPQVLGALVRRHGQFDACEDAVQEALLAAFQQWPAEGVPANPRGWLMTVATRRLTDFIRSSTARQRREETVHLQDVPSFAASEDDTLTLLYLCCHPSLSPPSQLALTLRAVGGLTTAQIAAAFMTPEATMAQRISRAKATIKSAGFESGDKRSVVLHVLYLMFNEGYTTSSGLVLNRPDLTAEAIRITRMLPLDGEVAGLLALMLLTEARRPARTTADGSLVPLEEQDRSLWDSRLIAEGVAIITDALARYPLGPYQVQAAIAAVHDEAPSADETDWKQILRLYDLLETIAPNPVVTLNKSVAVAMVHGPRAALQFLERLDGDDRIASTHRLDSVRAHLWEMAGDPSTARSLFLSAASRTTSIPEQQYLTAQAARLC